jgi:cytochrome P450
VGVPEALVEDFARAGDNFEAAYDDAVRPADMTPAEFQLEQLGILSQIGIDLVHHRRKHPDDDIATALANAELNGAPLTDDQITSVMLLLSIAGNDTTKQTTSWTAYNLDRNPEQKAWLQEDFEGRIWSAIDEFVRHASPVINFLRTATCDVELGGQQISEGDRVALFYCSGNRDESVFSDPHTFNLSRGGLATHVGFGGGGVHYCLGNNVARVQMRSLFREIFDKLPGLEITGEPDLLFSDFINGIKHLPARA